MTASQFISKHDLMPGDTIIARFKEKMWGLKGLNHYVVYLGDGMAIHNVPNDGVVEISMDDVVNSYTEVRKIERFSGDVSALLKRAKAAIGRHYNVLQFNCESLANMIRGKGTRSEQVESIVGAILAAVAFSLLLTAIIRVFLR